MPFAALYDACVLIPHEVRDILMILASTRQHAGYWYDDIFAEWIHNAVDKGLASQESVLRFQAIVNTMFPDAMIASARYERLIDSMTNDKKDRHVLAAAVVAEADVVVTSNAGDFPKPSVEPYRIQIQTPDEFVRTQAALIHSFSETVFSGVLKKETGLLKRSARDRCCRRILRCFLETVHRTCHRRGSIF